MIESGKAVGIAVDTLSLDFGASKDFATHYSWLPSGRWGLENVANLDQVRQGSNASGRWAKDRGRDRRVVGCVRAGVSLGFPSPGGRGAVVR